MFEEASNRITVWLSKTKIISSDQEVVCKWGMTHILDTLFNIATFTAIGLLFRMLPETAVFTVAYIPLRSFAGGYHAKTPFRCWVISNFLLIRGIANSSVCFSFYCLLFIADSFEFALSRCFDACI